MQLQNISSSKLLSFSFTISQSCCRSEYHHSCDWAAGDHMTDIQQHDGECDVDFIFLERFKYFEEMIVHQLSVIQMT